MGVKNRVVYEIYCVVTKQKYIGSTCDFERRKDQHIKMLICGKHHSYKLQSVYNRYGIDNLESAVIIEKKCDRVDIVIEEHKIISKIKDDKCLNINLDLNKELERISPLITKSDRINGSKPKINNRSRVINQKTKKKAIECWRFNKSVSMERLDIDEKEYNRLMKIAARIGYKSRSAKV